MATDTFTAANGTALTTYSGSWTQIVGAMEIQSNAVIGDTAVNFSAARWTADAFNSDHYAQVTVSGSANGYCGPGVRLSSDGDGYFLLWNPVANTLDLSRIDNGNSESNLDSIAAPPAGSVLRLEATGSVITAYVNGTPVMSESDPTYSGGAPGLYAYDDEAVFLDNFQADNLGTTASAVPPRIRLVRRPVRNDLSRRAS